jgi:hypothetical protein
MSSVGNITSGVVTVTSDPQLGPLQNNGGPTFTMLPGAGSPVLGVGNPDVAPATDQRGVARPSGGPTDLGAVQVSGTTPAATTPTASVVPSSDPSDGGSSSAGTGQTSAAFLGMTVEELESALDLVQDAVHMHNTPL